MTPAEFLKAVWPSSGYYCLATIFKTPEGKALYAHKVFATIDEAAAYAVRRKNEDMYFCVHSLKQEKVWNENKKNWKTGDMGAYEYRTQANMQEASTFFFDLDVGDAAGKYPSQRDAFVALKKFIADTELPYPMVTSSGGGLHVYWTVDTSLVSNEWVTTAARLKALANHHGLLADPARTTDTASVLRVVGTFNMKDKSNPREVVALKTAKPTALDDFLKRVSAAAIKAGITAENMRPKKFIDPVDDFFNGVSNTDMESRLPPVKFMEVLSACRMMVYLTRNAATLSQTQWYRGLGVAAHCVGGRATAHRWSDKYPGYSRDETDAKIDQALKFGVTTCGVLQKDCGAEHCNGCPLRGQINTPTNAARRTTVAEPVAVTTGPVEAPVTVEIIPPPKPYRLLKAGQVVVVTKNAEGDEQTSVVYDYPLYPLRRVRNDGHEIEQVVWRVEHTHDGKKEFVLDGDALTDSRKLGSALINKGSIYPDPENLGILRQYMTAYVRELQRSARAEAQQNFLGWDEEHREFTLRDKIICPEGEVKPAQLSTNALRAAAPVGKKGTLQRQIELLKFFARPEYIPQQVMILQGLAAPIFYATGFHGAIVNATGMPGASKSTSLSTAASFWGDPITYPINGTKDGATNRARAATIATLANLPVCVDEITKMSPEDAANMAFNITQPNPRKGLQSDGTFRKGIESHKATIMLSTANSSLQGLLAQDSAGNTAGAVRVIEMSFSNPKVHEKWDAEEYLLELKENYGHIGEEFIKVWLANKAVNERRVRSVMREVDVQGRIQSSERIWGGDFAAVLVAGEIAVANGWLAFDMAAIRKWLLEVQLLRMRGVVSQEFTGPSGLLTDYLSQISGDMVVTDKMNNGVDTIRKPRGPLLAHYHMDKKIIWVLRAGFRDYCQKRKANYLEALDDLHRVRVMDDGKALRIVPLINARKTLGVGTDFAGGQSWVFEVDMSHPEISGLLPVIVNEKPALSPERANLKAVKVD